MVNDLLKVVLLAEVHGGLLSKSVAEELFGMSVVESFRKKYPHVLFDHGFIGEGSRKVAAQRQKLARRKLTYARTLFTYLSWVPWIRFAGVTGSSSHGNAVSTDDIDVLLVVQHNRLWLSRFAEQLVFRVLGVRLSFGDKDRSDRICINYYVSERNVRIEPKRQDFFTALEIVTMEPIFKETYLNIILRQNEWIGTYFPYFLKKKGKVSRREIERIVSEYRWYYIFGDVLDWLAQLLQLLYMKIMGHRCKKGEIIERNEVRLFGDKEWKDREKELKKKLKFYYL